MKKLLLILFLFIGNAYAQQLDTTQKRVDLSKLKIHGLVTDHNLAVELSRSDWNLIGLAILDSQLKTRDGVRIFNSINSQILAQDSVKQKK